MRRALLQSVVLGILLVSGVGPLPGAADAARCQADFDQDGWVDAEDLSAAADTFGEGGCGPECIGDMDGDGDADGSDLARFLASWGRTDCLGVSLGADPAAIRFGESTTLTWTSHNAISCRLSPGAGAVAADGSLTTAPFETTVYTLTAADAGDTVVATATVAVDTSTTALQGRITDGATGLGLEGAAITATDGQNSWTTTTNSSGEFTLVGVHPGTLTIAVSKEGYLPQHYTAESSGGQMIQMDAALEASTGFATLFGTISDQASGLPIPGAVFSIVDAGGSRAATTAADGTYTLSGVSLGPVFLSITCAGYRPLSGQLAIPEPQAYELDFVLQPSSSLATLTGSVLNSLTLQPEADVEISVVNTGLITSTGADGTFALPEVPMGQQQVRISKPGFVDTVQTFSIQSDPYDVEMVFPFTMGEAYPDPVDRVLAGQVVDAMSGRPIAGAQVKALGTGRQAVTDADGWYSLFDLPEQAFSMICLAQGHDAVLVNLSAQSGGAPMFHYSLSPRSRGRVVGSVFDETTGEPVRFALVSAGEAGMAGAATEADGSFVLEGVPAGTCSLTVSHPAYLNRVSAPVEVQEAQTAAIDISLTPRAASGDLEGSVRDSATAAPIQGALLNVDGAGTSATTDGTGRYHLQNLPAGLVRIVITAGGYPTTERTAAVVAHEEAAAPALTTLDIDLDASDPTEPAAVTVSLAAAAGGSIESPDGRWVLVIPPNGLSGDALLTLERLAESNLAAPGEPLNVSPQMAGAGIKAMGPVARLRVQSALGTGPAPSLSGPVLVAGRYAQASAEASNTAESSIFPYYFSADYWAPMPVSPFEAAVDEINNLPVTVVDFGSISADDAGPQGGNSFILALGGAVGRIGPPQPNVKVIDKDGLAAVTQVQDPVNSPNPNALPLLFLHGWDPHSIVMNTDHVDPNEGFDAAGSLDEDRAGRFAFIIKDIVDSTNGVYRPVFVSHNPRAGMIPIGQAMAGLVNPRNFYGVPAAENPGSGNFPYLDAFGFSMGGVISRSYQAASGHVNNMVLAGTPNHGTFRFIDFLSLSPKFLLLRKAIEFWSPGTRDLLGYDDRLPPALSSNPRLSQLNRNGGSAPRGDLTLIAGADDSKLFGWMLPEPNDSVVPAESVFCRTSSFLDPPQASLLSVGAGAAKYEHLFGFNHFNFGSREFRIRDVIDLKAAITHGLSDWVVSKLQSSTATRFPGSEYIQYAAFEVTIEYNTFEPNIQDQSAGRDSRGFDRVALLIYGRDEEQNWHVRGYALADGSLINAEPVSGNSTARPETLRLSTSTSFQLTDRIIDIAIVVAPLKPGQTHVNLTPDAEFGLP